MLAVSPLQTEKEESMHSCRVLFVDDHPLVLASLAEMLRQRGCEVKTARGLGEALQHIQHAGREAQFDMVLLDINLGQENGIDLLEKTDLPLAGKVVLLSGIAEHEWVLHGFEKGAFGFIPKNVEPEEIVAALAAMFSAQRLQCSGWVWDSISKKLMDGLDFFPRSTTLTSKEREVFMLLRAGKLDKQIADELCLSIHTVRVHLRAIKRKRGHNRRSEQNIDW